MKIVIKGGFWIFSGWFRLILLCLLLAVNVFFFNSARGVVDEESENEALTEAGKVADVEDTQAAGEPERQTEIMADRGSMNFRTGTATFTGNVTVNDHDVTITSDELTIKLDEENQVQSLEAKGRVVIRQEEQDRVASGGYALYTVETRTVVLMDEPRLTVGKNVLDNAYRIIYNMDSELITTESKPGQRTTVVITSAGNRGTPESRQAKD